MFDAVFILLNQTIGHPYKSGVGQRILAKMVLIIFLLMTVAVVLALSAGPAGGLFLAACWPME